MKTFPSIAKIKDLNAQHPDFTANAQLYADLGMLYAGGQALKLNAGRFLRRRPKEVGPVYAARLQSFTYDNLIGSIVAWYTSKLYETPLQIESTIPGVDALPEQESEFYKEFLKDCDGAGSSLEKFFEKLTADTLVYGKSYFLIDLPKLDVVPSSLAEQEALGGLDPYLVYCDPASVVNWQCDKFGNYEWVVLHIVSTESTFLGSTEKVERWSYYDKQNFAIFEARYEGDSKPEIAKLIDSGLHAMAEQNEVPVHCIVADENLWLGNRVYLSMVDYLNIDNSYSWSLQLANVPIPVFTDGDNEAADPDQVGAEYSSLIVPKGGGFGFAEVEGKSFESAQRRLDSVKDAIYRMSHLNVQGKTSNGSDYQSGIAKQLQMSPACDILNVIGSLIRNSIEDALEDVAEIRGDGVDVAVSGMSFAEDDATGIVELVTELNGLNIPSDTFKKECLKKVIRSVCNDKGPGLLQKMCDDVEAAAIPAVESAVSVNVAEKVA